MASRVEERSSLVDAALDSAFGTAQLDLEWESEPVPETVVEAEPETAVGPPRPLWDIDVGMPWALMALPPGGLPDLTEPPDRPDRLEHRASAGEAPVESPPEPHPDEPTVEVEPDGGVLAFDPFGDTHPAPPRAHLPHAAPPEPIVYEPPAVDRSLDLTAEHAVIEAPEFDSAPEPRREPVLDPEPLPPGDDDWLDDESSFEDDSPVEARTVDVVAVFDDLVPAWDGAPERPRVASPPWSVFGSELLAWLRADPTRAGRAIAGSAAVVVLAAAAFTLVSSSDSGPAAGTAGPASVAPARLTDEGVSTVARATLPLIDVYESPTGDTVVATLSHPAPSGTPLVFLVEREWDGWYEVRVPAPPAGTTGWVRSDHVEVSEHEVRITVDLRDHLLVAREAGEVVLRAPVSVGRMDAPRPGLSFVTERVASGNPNSGYGTHALPLAGYENGQETFFRGQGLVAIHGTHDPLALGQTVTAGSIGLANGDIRRLYELAPLGTPVEIVDRGSAADPQSS